MGVPVPTSSPTFGNIGYLTCHLGYLNCLTDIALHLLHGTTGLASRCRSSAAFLGAGTIHGHVILALGSLYLSLSRLVHGFGLIEFLRTDHLLFVEFLHAVVRLLGNLQSGLCLLIELCGGLYLFLAGTVLCHLGDGRSGIGGIPCLYHLGLHLGSLDDGQCVASLYKVTLLHTEFKDTTGHLTRHTVFLYFHLTLYHFRVTAQGQETDECHDCYYCCESCHSQQDIVMLFFCFVCHNS